MNVGVHQDVLLVVVNPRIQVPLVPIIDTKSLALPKHHSGFIIWPANLAFSWNPADPLREGLVPWILFNAMPTFSQQAIWNLPCTPERRRPKKDLCQNLVCGRLPSWTDVTLPVFRGVALNKI